MENGVLSYRLLGEEIVVARFPKGLLAAQNSCPHKGMRLSRGCVRDHELRCPYHGWKFDREGACTNIPSLLQPLPDKQEQARLTTYAVKERYGMVWVKLDADELSPLPDVPEFEDPRWSYSVADPMVFQAGFRREIENYLDMTHFAFAHSTSLGVAADTIVPSMKITESADGFQMDAPFPSLASPEVQPGKLQQAHQRRQRCHLPNFTTIRQSFTDGDERVLVHIPSPNDPDRCTVFWALAISPGFRGRRPRTRWPSPSASSTRTGSCARTRCRGKCRSIPPAAAGACSSRPATLLPTPSRGRSGNFFSGASGRAEAYKEQKEPIR
jgi:vanillate O-demethylase monooxygenase subunit